MGKLFFLFLFFLITSCSLLNNAKVVEPKKVEKNIKGYNLSDNDLSLYMGYQSALIYGDIDKAEELIKRLIDNHPDFHEPYLDLVNIYVYKKKIAEAEEILQKAEKLGIEDEQLLLSKANIYLMKNDLNKALPVLNRIIELNPKKENVYLILANIYYQNKDYVKAISILQKLINVFPDNFFGNLYLGKIYETIEDNQKAAFYYERALKEREEDEVLMNLDRVYDKLGERLKSIDVLEKFLAINPDFPKVRERLGLLYVGENNYEKALEHFEILLKQFPDNLDLNLKTAFIAIEAKFYDKAENYLKNVLEKEPDNQKAIYFYGILLKDQRKWKNALDYFEKIKDSEYLKSSKLYMAVCYEKLGEKGKAKSILEELWSKEPDDEVGYFLALYYKNSKEYEKAINLIDKIPSDSKETQYRFIYLKSEILLKMGKFSEGIGLVEEILKKEPNNPDALNFIGYSYAEKGIELDRAEEMIKKALEQKPDDPYITDSLAWVYFMKGDYERALQYQLKVIEKIKDDSTILEHLGDIYRALKRIDDALKAYKDALNFEPENEEIINKKIKELENK